MKRWKYRYVYQWAGYVVCCGSMRLRDVFPDEEFSR